MLFIKRLLLGFGLAALSVASLRGQAPAITRQPVSFATVENANYSNIVFDVAYTGGTPLTVQWYKDGAPITIGVPNTIFDGRFLTINPLPSNAGDYKFTVTNGSGTATSQTAHLTLFPVLHNSVSPTSVTVNAGSTVVITGSVTGGSSPSNFSYQWSASPVSVPGISISGQTSPTLTLTNVQPSQSGNYYTLHVTDNYPTLNALQFSDSACRLTVLATTAPAIFSQSGAQTAIVGGAVNLSVSVSGTAPLQYQWSKNGAPIAGANSSTLNIPSASLADAATYTLTVTNPYGTATSSGISVTVGLAPQTPAFTQQPNAVTVTIGETASFSCAANGIPTPSFQWYKNGQAIGGATSSSFTLASAQPADAGDYTVVASNSVGLVTSAVAHLTVNPVAGSRLVNLSTRAPAGNGDATLISGFVISGSGPKQLLIRAVGPTLGTLGVPAVLSDPKMVVYDASTNAVAANQGWFNSSNLTDLTAVMPAVGAFSLPVASADSAVLTTFQPGLYTTQVTGGSGDTGVALLEIYETPSAVGSSPNRLVNISSRAKLTSDFNVMISGFVISGNAPEKLLIRAVGPTLAQLGVTNAMPDPKVRIVDSAGNTVAANDNWSSNPNLPDIAASAASVGAFALPANSKDALLLVSLSPGTYTAVVESADGNTGVVLVELYELQ